MKGFFEPEKVVSIRHKQAFNLRRNWSAVAAVYERRFFVDSAKNRRS
jgi:hypothetical protein